MTFLSPLILVSSIQSPPGLTLSSQAHLTPQISEKPMQLPQTVQKCSLVLIFPAIDCKKKLL
jgi:hypothetical protein